MHNKRQGGNVGKLWPLLIGSSLSTFGSRLALVALAVWAYTNTGSAIGIAGIGISATLGLIAGSIVSGPITDRWRGRRLLVVLDVLRLASVLGMTVSTSNPWLLYGLVAFENLFSAWPAFGVFVRDAVADSELQSANAVFQAGRQLMTIVGPAVGGLLVATAGIRSTLLVDAASYLVSAAGIWMTRVSLPAYSQPAQRLIESLEQGWTYVRQTEFLKAVVVTSLLLNIATNITFILTPYVALHVLAGNGRTVGLLETGMSTGGLIAGILLTFKRVSRQYSTFVACMIASAVVMAAIGLSHAVYITLAALAVAGFSVAAIGILSTTMFQLAVDRELLGRAMAAVSLVGLAATPAAQAIGGWLADQWSVGVPFTLGAVLLLLVACACAKHPWFDVLRRVGDSAPARPAQAEQSPVAGE
jgi:MFS family permease